jgi:hypothetical protein
MIKKRQKKATGFGIERVVPTQYEKEEQIKKDMDLVNSKPEENTYLTILLKVVTEFSEKIRASERGNVIDVTPRVFTPFTAVTKVYGGVNSVGPKKTLYNLEFRFDEVLERYQGQDLRRFRRCEWEKCKKYFWADRLNKRFCSKRCQDAFNQAEHRKRTPA